MALSPSRRGLLTIVGGTGAGQLLGVLAAPVLGRLFPPEVFGPFAVLNALVFAFAPVAALRYDMAITVPDDEREARTLAAIGLRLSGWIAVLGSLLTWVARDAIADLLGLSGRFDDIVLWAPLVAGLVGAFTVLNQFAIRERRYTAIARRNVLQAAATVALQVTAGVAGFGAHGLAAGLAFGQAIGVASLAFSLRDVLAGPAESAVGRAERRSVMARYKSFPLLLAPSGVVNSLGLQAPVLLASTLFGASVAGWLGMTQRVLAVPVGLFGLTLAQVYLGEFGQAKRSASVDLRALFMRTSRRLVLVGGVGAVVLLVGAPLLFEMVFGDQWGRSGGYAQALAVGLMFQMVASPLSQTIILMGKNHYQAGWDVARLLVCAGSVLVGHRMGLGDVGTMWALGISTAVMYVFLWLLSWRAVDRGADVPRTMPPAAPQS